MTCAERWQRAHGLGVEPHVVEACLGHMIKGVAGVYNRHAYAAEKRDALGKWAAHVAAIARR